MFCFTVFFSRMCVLMSRQVLTEDLEECFHPIVQSGGKYDLRLNAQTIAEDRLKAGVILCTLGARYKGYCSCISRTLLAPAASDTQKQNYEVLLALQKHLMERLLKPGEKLSGIYAACVAFLKDKSPALAGHITKSIGFSMGIEFRESQYLINEKSQRTVLKDMIFYLHLGLDKLTEGGGTYALTLGDMVRVGNDRAEFLTTECPRSLADVVHTISAPKHAEEEDDDMDIDENIHVDITEGRRLRNRGVCFLFFLPVSCWQTLTPRKANNTRIARIARRTKRSCFAKTRRKAWPSTQERQPHRPPAGRNWLYQSSSPTS